MFLSLFMRLFLISAVNIYKKEYEFASYLIAKKKLTYDKDQ